MTTSDTQEQRATATEVMLGIALGALALGGSIGTMAYSIGTASLGQVSALQWIGMAALAACIGTSFVFSIKGTVINFASMFAPKMVVFFLVVLFADAFVIANGIAGKMH